MTSADESVALALSSDERRALDDFCARQGVSRSRVMRDALRAWMLRHGEDVIRPGEEVCNAQRYVRRDHP